VLPLVGQAIKSGIPLDPTFAADRGTKRRHARNRGSSKCQTRVNIEKRRMPDAIRCRMGWNWWRLVMRMGAGRS
jgi:hypothetical protein